MSDPPHSGPGGASPLTLAELGEAGVLERIEAVFAPMGIPHSAVGPGDDAAVLVAPDARVVVTTDAMVEGQDFLPEWSSGRDVGLKAAAQNLADVAAMGAVPTGLVVTVVAPGSTGIEWVEALAGGLAEACMDAGAWVAGGDLSDGDQIVVSVTALGDLQGRSPVLRGGAVPGDVLAASGPFGRSAAGLAVLRSAREDVIARHPGVVAAHLRPVAPTPAGPRAARAGVTAMIDVSDGLLVDAGRIARASGVRIDVRTGSALLADSCRHLEPVAVDLGGSDPPMLALEWVLTGGEDHMLLVCCAAETVPEGFAVIGDVREPGVPRTRDHEAVVLVDGAAWSGPTGWDHYRVSE